MLATEYVKELLAEPRPRQAAELLHASATRRCVQENDIVPKLKERLVQVPHPRPAEWHASVRGGLQDLEDAHRASRERQSDMTPRGALATPACRAPRASFAATRVRGLRTTSANTAAMPRQYATRGTRATTAQPRPDDRTSEPSRGPTMINGHAARTASPTRRQGRVSAYRRRIW